MKHSVKLRFYSEIFNFIFFSRNFFILNIASKDLVYIKINLPTNEEREKNKYYHKNENQTSKTAFKNEKS